MFKLSLQYLPVAGIILVASCNQSNTSSSSQKEEVQTFNKDSLVQHIKILASDSFQGRKLINAEAIRDKCRWYFNSKNVYYLNHFSGG